MYKQSNLRIQEDLGQLLDNFTKATGIYIDAVDKQGSSLIGKRECEKSSFCKLIQETDEGKIKCNYSYKKASNQCVKWSEPYFFRCHAGLVMWAMPIISNDEHIGSIICGQVLLWKADKFFYKELQELNEGIENFEELKEKVEDLNIISAPKCKSIVNMMGVFVNHLAKTNNRMLLEEKALLQWKNYMMEQIESRKKEYRGYVFDNSVYIKREKTLLQHIRTGNKEKVIKLLPIIFSDIDILCNFEVDLIKENCIELVSVISRACVDAGIETDLVLSICREFKSNIHIYKTAEDLFNKLQKMILLLLDMVYVLGNNNQNAILKSARKYIENNYNEKITIDDISKDLYVSTFYLCHLFKDNLNYTVNDYITRVRVEKSVELLKKRELNVSDIGKLVGFNSQSHFIKVFKKIMGVTPGNYRNKYV